tara:strand:- start:6 stop:221 length:216 start_codon:yes stop_codon:yes gene_type:complete
MTYAETMALRQMKKGDVVKHLGALKSSMLLGIVLSKVEYEYRTDNLDSHYKILWRDGTISKAWDYDLVKVK